MLCFQLVHLLDLLKPVLIFSRKLIIGILMFAGFKEVSIWKKVFLENFLLLHTLLNFLCNLLEKFLVKWRFDRKYQDELLIPKIALAEQDIQDIIDEQGSKLLLKSTDKNSCVDFDSSRNGQWVSFPYGGSKQQDELNGLLSVLRMKAKQYPASSLQVKRAVCWNSKLKSDISFGILFLRHLNSQDKARVAHFLTGCNIDFFFSRGHVLVMKLYGLCDNTLLRLAQYAEVPIPACPCAGAFQVTFYPKSGGVSTWTSCSVGRIGSFDHVPAQVQLDASEQEKPIEGVNWLVTFLERQVEATCFQKVLCKPESQDSTVSLQFLIPVAHENKLPLQLNIEGKHVCVDHPAPFTVPLVISRRPFEEQDKFEHWKDTANRAFMHRKGRHNSLSHCPKLCPQATYSGMVKFCPQASTSLLCLRMISSLSFLSTVHLTWMMS